MQEKDEEVLNMDDFGQPAQSANQQVQEPQPTRPQQPPPFQQQPPPPQQDMLDGSEQDWRRIVEQAQEGEVFEDPETNIFYRKQNGVLVQVDAVNAQTPTAPSKQKGGFIDSLVSGQPRKRPGPDEKFRKADNIRHYERRDDEEERFHKKILLENAFIGDYYYNVIDINTNEDKLFAIFKGKYDVPTLRRLMRNTTGFKAGRYMVEFRCKVLSKYKDDRYDARVFELTEDGELRNPEVMDRPLNTYRDTKQRDDFAVEEPPQSHNQDIQQPPLPTLDLVNQLKGVLPSNDPTATAVIKMAESTMNMQIQQMQSNSKNMQQFIQLQNEQMKSENARLRDEAQKNQDRIFKIMEANKNNPGNNNLASAKDLIDMWNEGRRDSESNNKLLEIGTGIATAFATAVAAKQQMLSQAPAQPQLPPAEDTQPKLPNKESEKMTIEQRYTKLLKNMVKDMLKAYQNYIAASDAEKPALEQYTNTTFWISKIMLNKPFALFVLKKTQSELIDVAKGINKNVKQYESALAPWIADFLTELRVTYLEGVNAEAQQITAMVQNEAGDNPQEEPEEPEDNDEIDYGVDDEQ